MTTGQTDVRAAPFCMMITFEIAPEDEPEFNDIYDNDHIPNILKLKEVVEVVRFRDAAPNEKGFLVYSAIYFLTHENFHEIPTVYRGPYEFSVPERADDHWPQNEPPTGPARASAH